MSELRSGFISIVGHPNVGKSTLMNRLVGMKLAAVSKKPQTTRQVIRGILTEKRGQLVFLDTPGIHAPRDLMGRLMVRQASKTFSEADLVYVMVEPRLSRGTEQGRSEESVDRLMTEVDLQVKGRKDKPPVFCVVNKIDTVPKTALLPVLDQFQKRFSFSELIPISALQGDQVDILLAKTFEHLREHEPYFPSDMTSDQPEKFLAGELIREKIFRFTGEEIPYASAVDVEEFKEEGQLVRIHAVIFTERDSQKAILIGAQGQKMKQLGTAARMDLEKWLGKKVFLKLWVKTLKNWKKDERQLKRLGFQ
ncbi:MAG: GTPase Era [Omnitrophica bacterium RIFCSPHIGHO2_02_FULL_49_9]|nr:MAG: GTPase Era [Omnitrophica bacterium RIFCSPHIGHO2_02_FULL_49_9]OGW89974.1 MAG: GTPase Era [Omnitrophica bacterium RIFCSPLOWO2_01_FULL_50_24]